MELAELGLSTRYERLPVAELGDDVWQGVRSKYWSFPLYFMPVVTHSSCGSPKETAAGTS